METEASKDHNPIPKKGYTYYIILETVACKERTVPSSPRVVYKNSVLLNTIKGITCAVLQKSQRSDILAIICLNLKKLSL